MSWEELFELSFSDYTLYCIEKLNSKKTLFYEFLCFSNTKTTKIIMPQKLRSLSAKIL